MRFIGVLIVLCLMVICVENIMIPINYPRSDIIESVTLSEDAEEGNNQYYNPFGVIGLSDLPKTTHGYNYEHRSREYGFQFKKKRANEITNKPCSVVVVSNGQNTAMQSLLRRYRYDANGVLIPSSVKYYIKMPQGFGSAPILVPLTGKAFSPLGGFVRYYKEVPPISPSL